jgi:hypothetical protein
MTDITIHLFLKLWKRQLEGKPAFKIVLLSNLGWIPPIRLLMSQWRPIIFIIVWILLLVRHSRPKQ